MAEPPLVLNPASPRWPHELAAVVPPCEALWLAGRAELLEHRPRVAIVGSRSPTPYGEAQARRFAGALAAAGCSVVSGLARGVDAAAHGGALDAGGATLAVLGTGVDRPWPAGPLADRMLSEGLLVSDFPPGTEARRHHFPLRNRLISGLSQAVIVIEAAEASGSLITARWAADQGRSVFALPGRVDHPMARGCHRLIREGAELVESPEQVLEELGLRASPPRAASDEAAAAHSRIVTALTGETLGLDELAARLARAPGDLVVELMELELAGALIKLPGGLWRLAERGG